MTRPAEVEGKTVPVSASIGIAGYPSDGTDVETLVKHADIALYESKRSDSLRVHLFPGNPSSPM